MSFFGNLFGTKKTAESVALIEIGPDSIAGGFGYFKRGETPLIVYASRAPIQQAQGESPVQATVRTLDVLGQSLIGQGAPLLLRAAGSGRIDSVLVSVKAPWQETTIRSEKIERTERFFFTRALLNTALVKSAEAPQGRLLADEIVVGTILDGYETKKAIGKRASRVSIIVLSSFIDEQLSLAIAEGLRKLFHTTSIRLVAAAAIRYEALQAVFPHEDEYLTVDITGGAIVTTLIRRGLLSAVEHATADTAPGIQDAWLGALTKTLEAITKRYPLPRKVLLLAAESDRAALKQKIEGAPLASLRLSEDPPAVIPISPSNLTDIVRIAENVEPDLGLELMAAFWRKVES